METPRKKISEAKKTIIVVNYLSDFNIGVGARRALLFTKYLHDGGNEVILFTSDYKNERREIQTGICTAHRFYQTKYPKVLDENPKSIYSKLLYRFHLVLRKIWLKGSIYDKAALDEFNLKSGLKDLVNTYNPDVIIASGAPFSVLYYSLSVAKKKEIAFIADFRDPWSWGNGYGFNSLSNRRLLYEKKMELEVVRSSNHISVASSDLRNKLTSLYPVSNSKFSIIYNGFHFEEQSEQRINRSTNKQVLRIVHFGTVGDYENNYWSKFLEFCDTSELIRLDFIGNGNKELLGFVKKSNIKNVRFLEKIRQGIIKDTLSKYDLGIIFKRKGLPDSFPTKFFEYLGCGIPVLIFTEKGEVMNLVNSHQLGLALEMVDISLLNEFVFKLREHPRDKVEYPFKEFSMFHQVEKLREVLENNL